MLVKEGDKKPIIIHITDGIMELKINSAVGSMNEEIDIDKKGKDRLLLTGKLPLYCQIQKQYVYP